MSRLIYGPLSPYNVLPCLLNRKSGSILPRSTQPLRLFRIMFFSSSGWLLTLSLVLLPITGTNRSTSRSHDADL